MAPSYRIKGRRKSSPVRETPLTPEFDPKSPEDVQRVNDLGYQLAKKMHPDSDCLVVSHVDGRGKKPHNHILVINHNNRTGEGALGLSHVPRPQGRESAGRPVGERPADARTRALGREAAGARTEGLGAAPRGLRRGIARPRDGRPDERGAGRSPGGGQGRSGLGDRGAEPVARR
ncbi:relaxase/mobilization nuclease domain-containing protein [Actinomyces bowdenii]|uniref:relaxase/mobilization nuclease domain-containing protein n=1 Tax=Actinomyces bowdenii TaxID=131109 RepID=UPI001D1633D2|nr:relaxase/mobilization nuclease domain-containing protein [Actinomyces bowdenii]